MRWFLLPVTKRAAGIAVRVFPMLNWRHLEALVRRGLMPQSAANAFFMFTFAERRLRFFEGLQEQQHDALSELGFLWQSRVLHYRGLPLVDGKGIVRLNSLALNPQNIFARSFVRLAITNAIMSRDTLGLVELMDTLGPSRLMLLGRREIANIFRFLLASANAPPLDRIEELFGKVNHDRQLDTVLLDVPAFTRVKHIGWRAVFKALDVQLTHTSAREQLREAYEQTANLISLRDDFIDARSDTETLMRLQDRLLGIKARGEPFSFLRLGDGEAYCFYAADAPEALASHSLREQHWWSTSLTVEQRTKIAARVRRAIERADMIGIPAAYRFARDIEIGARDLTEARPARDLFTVLEGLYRARNRLKASAFTEDRVNACVFDRAFLAKLLNASDNTLIVSCWSESQLSQHFSGRCTYVQIPGQAKLRGDGVPNEAPLCETYEHIEQIIAETVKPGTLVLVAAGILGKSFVTLAADHGAMAIDIGSTIDYVAGRITRDPSTVV